MREVALFQVRECLIAVSIALVGKMARSVDTNVKYQKGVPLCTDEIGIQVSVPNLLLCYLFSVNYAFQIPGQLEF